MEYLYCFANASLTLRIVEYLASSACPFGIRFVTVLHQLNGWVVRIVTTGVESRSQSLNFHALLLELGVPFQANRRMKAAMLELEQGDSPVDVMRHYQLAIVSHGPPDSEEIEAFRRQFISGLGYCPATLA